MRPGPRAKLLALARLLLSLLAGAGEGGAACFLVTSHGASPLLRLLPRVSLAVLGKLASGSSCLSVSSLSEKLPFPEGGVPVSKDR